MTKADDAHRSFLKRFTCSAAAFSASSPEPGLDPDTAKKIACGFGAGISGTGNICGAVSGGIMVTGLKSGKCVEGDEAATGKSRALVRQFIREFTKTNGSVNCTELTIGQKVSVDNPGPVRARIGLPGERNVSVSQKYVPGYLPGQ